MRRTLFSFLMNSAVLLLLMKCLQTPRAQASKKSNDSSRCSRLSSASGHSQASYHWKCLLEVAPELNPEFSSQTHLICSRTWHAVPPLSWWLRCALGTLAWAVTCELKTQVAIMAHPHKLLRFVYTYGVLSSTPILVPEFPKAEKNNSCYTVTHIATIPQKEIE